MGIAIVRVVLQTERGLVMKNNNNGSNNKAAMYLVGFLLSLQCILIVVPTIEIEQVFIMGGISAILFILMVDALNDDMEDK